MGKSCKNRKRVSGWHDVSSPYVLQWVFLINEDITLYYYKPYTSGININVYHSCIISDLIYILSNHVFYEKRSNSESYIVSSCHIIEVIKASKVLVTQSCPNLCDPMDCIPPGSSVHGILQARTLEWVAVPFSRGPSWPRNRSTSLMSPGLAGRFFTTSITWEAHTLE